MKNKPGTAIIGARASASCRAIELQQARLPGRSPGQPVAIAFRPD